MPLVLFFFSGDFLFCPERRGQWGRPAPTQVLYLIAPSMTLTTSAGRGAYVACLVAAIGGLLACLALPATAQSCPVPGLSLLS